jgi:hypothetical protein
MKVKVCDLCLLEGKTAIAIGQFKITRGKAILRFQLCPLHSKNDAQKIADKVYTSPNPEYALGKMITDHYNTAFNKQIKKFEKLGGWH